MKTTNVIPHLNNWRTKHFAIRNVLCWNICRTRDVVVYFQKCTRTLSELMKICVLHWCNLQDLIYVFKSISLHIKRIHFYPNETKKKKNNLALDLSRDKDHPHIDVYQDWSLSVKPSTVIDCIICERLTYNVPTDRHVLSNMIDRFRMEFTSKYRTNVRVCYVARLSVVWD